MKELEFIRIIQDSLSKNAYIGDDCAYLKDLGIVITQDSMVEDVHFLRKFATAYEIGYKAIMVNLSDVYASGAIPKYVTISLSLPADIENDFVKDFYSAVDDLSKAFNFEVVGGDVTGADKCYISICAIGVTEGRNISSRVNAKVGDYLVVTGNHGSSAAGLWLLSNNNRNFENLTNANLKPVAQKDCSEEISKNITDSYAMMDTSDGLADALFKIAQASNVLVSVDFDKISYDKDIEKVANLANLDFKDWVLYGGEDFQLVACVSEKDIAKLKKFNIIGRVKEKSEKHFVEVNFGDKIEKIVDLEKTYNHFGG